MRRLALVFLVCVVPAVAFAEAAPHGGAVLLIASSAAAPFQGAVSLTRREGFLILWNAIRRPAEEVSVGDFSDVSDGDSGYIEINYAKARKILEDERTFRPDDVLTYEDALLWLFRTRNVADLSDMEREDLGSLLKRFPVLPSNVDLAAVVPAVEALQDLMRMLDETLASEVHEISFYGEGFHGNGTAFGETFDKEALTAAHRNLPRNTLVRVRNIENGKSIVVRINDRGPYHPGRDLDLSEAAFAKISPIGSGIARATFQRLGDAELFDACTGEPRRYQRRITRDVHFFRGIPHTFTLGETLVLQSHRFFVLRGITYPDHTFVRLQDFVAPREKFSFTPSQEGEYVFLVGTSAGRRREMRMRVAAC